MSSSGFVRVLFLSDTHLGEDLPQRRTTVERRRRWTEFFDNFDRALEPALDGRADLVVHGGDVFFRSRVKAGLVRMVLERIEAVVERGVPVAVVPGNHERSSMPFPLFWQMEGIYLFEKPTTHRLHIGGLSVALSGFPYSRAVMPEVFPSLVESTGWRSTPADARLLCLHQAVEGAVVGPSDYVFRRGGDVIPGKLIPEGFAAVLSGHIHREQVLTRDLAGMPIASPVIYAGSTERTSFAEKNEQKGYYVIDLAPTGSGTGRIRSKRFAHLATRPMIDLSLPADTGSYDALAQDLCRALSGLDPHAIVRITLEGPACETAGRALRAGVLRRLAPSTMNVSLRSRSLSSRSEGSGQIAG